MIYEITCYSAECDVCGDMFEHYNEGWSMFPGRSDVKEYAENQGWYIDTNNRAYCPKCHHIDDEDNLIIHNKKGE